MSYNFVAIRVQESNTLRESGMTTLQLKSEHLRN